MDPQTSEKLVAGVVLEVAELGPTLQEIVGLPVGQQIREVGVLGSEGITEVRVDKSAIRVGVIPSDKCIRVVLMAEDSIILKTFLKLWRGDPTLGLNISELEGIKKVEISMLNQLDFCVLKFTLMLDHVFQYLY